MSNELSVELTSDNIDKAINLVSEIKESKVVDIKSKKKLKNLKEKVEEALDNTLDLSVYSDVELEHLATSTDFGADIKKLTGCINFKMGNLAEASEKEIELTIKRDFESDFEYAIVLDKIEYTKLDFLNLYNTFNALESSVVNSIVSTIKEKRKNLIDSEQLDMFPELKNSDLACIEINTQIFNLKKGETLDVVLRFVGQRDGLICLEFDKKIWLNKADIYFIYNKFDSIINKILNISDNED